jgi:hypothetical protein
MGRVLAVVSALVFLSCAGGATRSDRSIYNIDSLINAQVEVLLQGKRQLRKKATIGEQTATVVVTPDSLGWTTELEVFRRLEIAERPVYKDRYHVEETGDPNSNLRIKSFTAEDTPVPLIRLFYLDDAADVRRIESRYSESNALYISSRDVVMEFEDEGRTLILKHFKIEGFQKIIMGDSVHFSVEGEVL